MKIITIKRPVTDGTQDELFETVAEAKVHEPFNELVELNHDKMINFVSLRSASGILESLTES